VVAGIIKKEEGEGNGFRRRPRVEVRILKKTFKQRNGANRDQTAPVAIINGKKRDLGRGRGESPAQQESFAKKKKKNKKWSKNNDSPLHRRSLNRPTKPQLFIRSTRQPWQSRPKRKKPGVENLCAKKS